MTPQFTTPCYVRIEDADKRKEVCEKLDKLGYTPAFSFSKNRYPFIIAHDSQWDTISESTLSDALAFICKYFTDCGTNTELFLALAGMREDTDYLQKFTDGENVIICYGIDLLKEDYIPCDLEEIKKYHKMTAAEIINHHKQKGE